jgi:hypothetical protein
MNALYIVTSGGLYGNFGRGTTIEEARRNWKKAGGRKSHPGYREQQFTSDLPFVPIDEKREANPDEADAFIAGDGSVCWIRCTREADSRL